MPHVTLHEHNDELAAAEAPSSSKPWYGKFLRCALQRQKKSCSIRSSPGPTRPVGAGACGFWAFPAR
jgi:hypothetical protein